MWAVLVTLSSAEEEVIIAIVIIIIIVVVIIITVAIIGILIVGSEFYIALPIPVTRVSEGFVGLVNLN